MSYKMHRVQYYGWFYIHNLLVGWLEFIVTFQHTYSYIRENITYWSTCPFYKVNGSNSRVGLSAGTQASGYPLSNGYPGSKISARVGMVGPPVVTNTSQLAKISAAMKSFTPRVTVALLPATEASHLSGRQGADEVGRAGWVCGLAAWVTLPPAVLLQRQDAIAIVRRTCLYPHSQRRRLLNLAWHRWLLNISQSQLGCLMLPG